MSHLHGCEGQRGAESAGGGGHAAPRQAATLQLLRVLGADLEPGLAGHDLQPAGALLAPKHTQADHLRGREVVKFG